MAAGGTALLAAGPISERPVGQAGFHAAESKMVALRARRGGSAAVAAKRLLVAACLCLSSRFLSPADATGQAESGGAPVAAAPHRRFEYKYSFKGPHLVQPDGSVPFWVHTGSK